MCFFIVYLLKIITSIIKANTIIVSTIITYKNYHCLRHTFATRFVRVGIDVKSLSEILGHSNISVTSSIYVHSSYEIKKKFIDKL
jgi:site-specific recombinase XerD